MPAKSKTAQLEQYYKNPKELAGTRTDLQKDITSELFKLFETYGYLSEDKIGAHFINDTILAPSNIITLINFSSYSFLENDEIEIVAFPQWENIFLEAYNNGEMSRDDFKTFYTKEVREKYGSNTYETY